MTARPAASSQSVLLESLDAGVLTLTLNRPERLNAMNIALIQALLAAARARGGGFRVPGRSHHRRRQGFLRRGGSHRPRARSRRRST